MYRLQFVYSDGTDDFDYQDGIETYDHEFETPISLIETFIALAERHPQIEHYTIMDPQYKEPMQSIYHFLLENLKDQACYDLADRIHEVTKLDWEQYDKFFGPVVEKETREAWVDSFLEKWNKTEPLSKEEKPVKNGNKKCTVDVTDLDVFDLEWIIEVLEYQVPNLVLRPNDHVQMFIQKLRVACSEKRKAEKDKEEYQEYLRLKEKFEGVAQ